MNKINLKTYYEDDESICVYDCETLIGVSIDTYENGGDYWAEIIPCFSREDNFHQNKIITSTTNLRAKLTMVEDDYETLMDEISGLYDDNLTGHYEKTVEGFACEIPKSFWEYGKTDEDGSDRLSICEDFIKEIIPLLRKSRITLIRDMTEELCDEYDDKFSHVYEFNSEDTSDDIEDALSMEFVSDKDVFSFQYKDILRYIKYGEADSRKIKTVYEIYCDVLV